MCTSGWSNPHRTSRTAAKTGTKLSRGANFRCLMSETPIAPAYIKAEGMAGRMGARLMVIVAEGDRGRVYLAPTDEHADVASQPNPEWKPEASVPERLTGGTCYGYGLTTFGDLFTSRQLVALNTFSDLVTEVRDRVRQDALAAGLPDDEQPLHAGGIRGTAYADAIAVYLAFAVDRMAMTGNCLVRWNPVGQKAQHCFGRQALPMIWDFSEPNFLATLTGSVAAAILYSCDPLNSMEPCSNGQGFQMNAVSSTAFSPKIISTDPPYYDNVAYADLSDFFYVWLRRSLKPIFPELFTTLTVPKTDELVATPYRHRSKVDAYRFFLDGMTRAMERLYEQTYSEFPITIYYAFKQSEKKVNVGETNTGWETFLGAIVSAGLSISGTWPMHTEMRTRQIAMDTNALASSIVLVCNKRPDGAPIATRRDFITALKTELPSALAHMRRGNIAPVDLAQAAIGPGMAVYTRYAKVLDASGNRVSVGEALALINQTLDETLAEQEGDFDAGSRWALAWFEQYGFDAGDYGSAETLSTAKNTSVSGMVEAGILHSRGGKVRLLRPEELSADWDPARGDRLTTWEIVHHVIRVLEQSGEASAAQLARKLGGRAEIAREFCYRLYTLCERKKRAADALAYNGLVQSWPEISRLARMEARPEQAELFAGEGTEGTR